MVVREAGSGLATAIQFKCRMASRGQRIQYPQSGDAVHARGFMSGVLTIISRDMVTIPRVKLGGIARATYAVDWRQPFIRPTRRYFEDIIF